MIECFKLDVCMSIHAMTLLPNILYKVNKAAVCFSVVGPKLCALDLCIWGLLVIMTCIICVVMLGHYIFGGRLNMHGRPPLCRQVFTAQNKAICIACYVIDSVDRGPGVCTSLLLCASMSCNWIGRILSFDRCMRSIHDVCMKSFQQGMHIAQISQCQNIHSTSTCTN